MLHRRRATIFHFPLQERLLLKNLPFVIHDWVMDGLNKIFAFL